MKRNLIEEKIQELKKLLKNEGILVKGFGLVYKGVLQSKDLYLKAKAIYAYLCAFAGNSNKCYPSVKKITNDLIRVGAPYWLASKSGSYYMWYVTEGGTVATDHVGMYGVRMIVTLKQDVKTEGQNDKKEWILNEDVKKDE